MRDLLIRGGRVADGTGGEIRTADVAISAGIITEVGRVSGPARRTIDADGLLVTPGFVDIHTHFDGQATWDPYLTPSIWHGVTTAILGNCGVGFAPVRPGHERELVELMEGVEDIPGVALNAGIRWGWESFAEYLGALERMPRALSVGAHVPHAALRAYVMGDRAQEAATAEDMAAMRALVRDAVCAGALGVSTGRTAGHRDVRGVPVPGTFAVEEEVEALLAGMSDAGSGVLELVPAGATGALGGDADGDMDRELAWMVRLGERYRRPITFLVLQRSDAPDLWRPWLEVARAANAAGAHIRPQVASRCFGLLLGHRSRMNPLKYRPSYRALDALPFPDKIARLRDPELRARILAEPPELPAAPALDAFTSAALRRVFPLRAPLDYEPPPEQSVAAIAARTGQDPWAVTYDLMLGNEGRDFLLCPLLNYGGGSYAGLAEMLADPLTVQGLGDGGAHCGIVCDASMTTYLLCHWARDRSRGPRLELAAAVRRLTAEPAALYGLGDRGVLRPGARADVNLIDFAALALEPPERVEDLPGGAGRIVQRATGYVETLVAGETVVANGEVTGALPGGVARAPAANHTA